MFPRRNDPCPCGSGKKYKKCCMLLEKKIVDEIAIPEVISKLEKGKQLKRDGYFQPVLKLYNYLNKKYPNNPLVYKSLAKLYICMGDYSKALEYFKVAKNGYAKYHAIEQVQICSNHIMFLSISEKDSQFFKDYVKGIGGNQLPSPKIFSDIQISNIFNETENINYFKSNGFYKLLTSKLNDVVSVANSLCKYINVTDSFISAYNFISDKLFDKYNDKLENLYNFDKEVDKDKIYFINLLKIQIFLLGRALFAKGNLYEAKYFLIESLGLDNKYVLAYEMLGDIFKQEKKYELAKLHYKAGLDICESDMKIHMYIEKKELFLGLYYELSFVCKQLEDYDSVTYYLNKATENKNDGFFGYIYDGYDDLKDALEDIGAIQDDFSKIKSPAQEDYDDIFIKLSEATEKLLTYSPSDENLDSELCNKFKFYPLLSNEGRQFLKSAEYLYKIFPMYLDYSPVMIEYCKVFEVELYDKIFLKLENWCKKNLIKIQTGPNKYYDINKFDKITLGSYKYLVQDKMFIKYVNDNYTSTDIINFLLNDLSNVIDNILNYRNSSAHKHSSTFEKVTKVKSILIEKGILASLCSFNIN